MIEFSIKPWVAFYVGEKNAVSPNTTFLKRQSCSEQ